VGAFRALREAALPFRLLTNATQRSRRTVRERLSRLGFPVADDEIFTAPMATRRILEARGSPPTLFLATPDALREFEGIPTDRQSPRCVVVGDMGEAFDYGALNEGFRALMRGADLIAMVRSRYWERGDGLALDAGPFVAALEYATGVVATVAGKPEAAFYRWALSDLGAVPETAAMIGDDVEFDLTGAAALGMRTILVRTGKFREADLVNPPVVPDRVEPDFAAAIERILGG
jgi:HAD superfamily hydrolase (TIGR01458 family)